MLRIFITEATDIVRLQLDGQISGPWVELLQSTCEIALQRGVPVTIDLRNVNFSDRSGIALLQSLQHRQVEILNPLPFIAEQIRNALPS